MTILLYAILYLVIGGFFGGIAIKCDFEDKRIPYVVGLWIVLVPIILGLLIWYLLTELVKILTKNKENENSSTGTNGMDSI
jgi:hypothetical protein